MLFFIDKSEIQQRAKNKTTFAKNEICIIKITLNS